MTADASYQASPIKRSRRSKAEVDAVKAAIFEFCQEHQPVTVRAVFYNLSTRGLIAKTEGEYNSTVVRLAAQMRRRGEMPFHWIADNSRWMRKPNTYGSLEEAARATATFYRRRLWDQQDEYTEVWIEKDGLAGVLYPITSGYDVPLMATKGYPSLSFLHSAARQIADTGKPTTIIYLGDHDPSGVDIPRKVEADLSEFAPAVDIDLHRLAVNPDQIAAWGLPSRPTKKTDTRAKGFAGDSVEVDAIPPDQLRNMVELAIADLIDPHALAVTRAAETSEREFLTSWAGEVARGAAPMDGGAI